LEKYSVISFKSTHDAIKGETLIKREGTEGRLIPLPPEVSAGCGLALRLDPKDLEAVTSLFDAEGVKYDGIYGLTREDGKRKVTRTDG